MLIFNKPVYWLGIDPFSAMRALRRFVNSYLYVFLPVTERDYINHNRPPLPNLSYKFAIPLPISLYDYFLSFHVNRL